MVAVGELGGLRRGVEGNGRGGRETPQSVIPELFFAVSGKSPLKVEALYDRRPPNYF